MKTDSSDDWGQMSAFLRFVLQALRNRYNIEEDARRDSLTLAASTASVIASAGTCLLPDHLTNCHVSLSLLVITQSWKPESF